MPNALLWTEQSCPTLDANSSPTEKHCRHLIFSLLEIISSHHLHTCLGLSFPGKLDPRLSSRHSLTTLPLVPCEAHAYLSALVDRRGSSAPTNSVCAVSQPQSQCPPQFQVHCCPTMRNRVCSSTSLLCKAPSVASHHENQSPFRSHLNIWQDETQKALSSDPQPLSQIIMSHGVKLKTVCASLKQNCSRHNAQTHTHTVSSKWQGARRLLFSQSSTNGFSWSNQ